MVSIDKKWIVRDPAFLAVLFFLAIMPFDAVTFLPGLYRPLNAYLCLFTILFSLYYFLIVRKMRLEPAIYLIIFFFAYSVGVSAAKSAFALRDMSGFLDFLTSFCVGMLFFVSAYHCLSRLKAEEGEDYQYAAAKSLFPVYCVSLLYGALQIGTYFIGPLASIGYSLRLFFSGNAVYSVQWFSREQAWGASNVIFFLPFLRELCRRDRKYRKWMMLAYVELLASFSTSGILSVMCIAILNWFANSRKRAKAVLLTVLTILLCYVGVGLLLRIPTNLRYIDRFRTVYKTFNIADFMQYSDSETVRLGFPAAGFLEMEKDPLLGVGGGNSRFYLEEYVYRYFPWARRMKEASAYLESKGSQATPRNMLARVAGETGIVGIALIFALLGILYRGISCEDEEKKTLYKDVLITTVMLNMQFDSFAYAPMWFGIAFLIAGLSSRSALSRGSLAAEGIA